MASVHCAIVCEITILRNDHVHKVYRGPGRFIIYTFIGSNITRSWRVRDMWPIVLQTSTHGHVMKRHCGADKGSVYETIQLQVTRTEGASFLVSLSAAMLFYIRQHFIPRSAINGNLSFFMLRLKYGMVSTVFSLSAL